jgi:hypothetical protein
MPLMGNIAVATSVVPSAPYRHPVRSREPTAEAAALDVRLENSLKKCGWRMTGELLLFFSTFHPFLMPSTRLQTSVGVLSVG